MSRTAQQPVEHPRPDPARIFGISAAIACNAALLMLLLRPIEIAFPNATLAQIPVSWIELAKPKPVEVVAVAKPHPVVQPHAQATPRPKAAAVLTVNRTLMSTDVIIPPEVIDEHPPQVVTTRNDPTPIEASLAYRNASPPPYPRDAMREGIEGTVQLRVLVDETGHVLEVRIERSSGDRQLDAAAREQVLRHWLFEPAQREGVPMRAWGLVPIMFRLDNR